MQNMKTSKNLYKKFSKTSFFRWRGRTFPYIPRLISHFKQTVRVGSIVKTILITEQIPFEVAVLFKLGFFRNLLQFTDRVAFKGVCVARYNKRLASSFTLRLFDKEFVADRRFFLFSPKLVGFANYRKSLASAKVSFKSKLYFLTKSSQKKLLIFFNS